MSKVGKFSLFFSVIFFLGLLGARLILGGWESFMWAPLAISVILFLVGMFKEWRLLLEFFTLRTTKHGMNMGVMIVLAIAGLACVNFLAARYERKFDWTQDQLNSLSEQSKKAAGNLKKETEIVLVFKKDPQSENVVRSLRDLVGMYQNHTKNLRFVSYDAIQRPDVSQKYDFQYGNQIIWAVQGDNKVKIDPPSEEGLTRALIKLGREKKKTIYFVKGHGELDIEDRAETGLSSVKDELLVTYDVKPLTLFQSQNKVPDDAEAVAVIGPKQQFLEIELQALRDYARRGGRLLLALDPGTRHNLALLTKTLGVEFQNNFVLDLRSQVVQGGPAMVLGTDFSKGSEISKAFDTGGMFSIFYLASNLVAAPGLPESIKIDPFIKTDARTMAINEMKEKVEFSPNGPHAIAMTVSGKLPAGKDAAKEPEGKEFSAVIFGDSDFMANNLVHNNINRDLAMNAMAWLTADKDLITIRPKEAKGTKLEMSNQAFMILLLGFIIPLPLILLGTGGFFWWRRRTA